MARVLPSSQPLPTNPPEYVFGDSTRFEPGFDFITSLRATVACGVELMKAQHAIDCARGRVSDAEEHLVLTRADLIAMADAVDDAVASHTSRLTEVKDVALRVGSLARAAMTQQIRHLQAGLDATLVRADRTIVDARKASATALGQLLAKHPLPGQSQGFRVFASQGRYGAESLVALPNLRATFDADIQEGHALARLFRVRDVRENVTVTLPRTVGWFTKQVTPSPVRLDAFAVLGMSIDGSRAALLLGKNESSGILHAFDLELGAHPARARWRDPEERSHYDLGPDDAACLAALLRDLERRFRAVHLLRTSITEALLEGRPLSEQDPRQACARLVALVAPVAREIASRSGAAGELVLRRNVGSGHRDEVFVTSAELRELIDTLPPSLRSVFSALGLDGQPRSRRAPPRSLPTYEELSSADLVSVVASARSMFEFRA